MHLNKIQAVTIAFVLLLAILSSPYLSAQIEPQPCNDPDNNGIGCYYETAGILCTPDQLDA